MSDPVKVVKLSGLGEFRPFILNSWLEAYKKSRWAGCVPNNLYVATHEKAIEGLLGRGAEIVAVVAADDPNQLLSWLCYETSGKGLIAHFGYTKEIYRKQGMMTRLLTNVGYRHGDPAFVTFRTDDAKFFPGFRHAPQLARKRSL